ncbi:MAG: RNA methyltransferase [Candidatus Riflebacteria bacterium]|nr:RNA methyltransferase [Candidatus Riflebacteria bacterium]
MKISYEDVAEALEAWHGNRETVDPWIDRGYACIGLDNPHKPENIGAALRAAGCFGVSMVAISGARFRKQSTDVFHDYRRIPLLRVNDLQSVVPFHCVPVAIELVDGATPLHEYEHPAQAFYVFGGEDATLGKRVLEWCRDVVKIPTRGCLNLGACVNVVLYDRLQKQLGKLT